eukprot:4283947-Prymnesium_polylepis.1
MRASLPVGRARETAHIPLGRFTPIRARDTRGARRSPAVPSTSSSHPARSAAPAPASRACHGRSPRGCACTRRTTPPSALPAPSAVAAFRPLSPAQGRQPVHARAGSRIWCVGRAGGLWRALAAVAQSVAQLDDRDLALAQRLRGGACGAGRVER